MRNRDIFTYTCGGILIVSLIASLWWEYAFGVGIAVAVIHTVIFLCLEDYDKDKRIRELENKLTPVDTIAKDKKEVKK